MSVPVLQKILQEKKNLPPLKKIRREKRKKITYNKRKTRVQCLRVIFRLLTFLWFLSKYPSNKPEAVKDICCYKGSAVVECITIKGNNMFCTLPVRHFFF